MFEEKWQRRFWPKVDRSGGPDACWPWVATRLAGGYGRFYVGMGSKLAHRVAFYLSNGRWPEPCCLHSCDNPPCCNPRHLSEGTHQENMADRDAKGRMVIPRKT